MCPWELVEASIRATQPYDVFFLRSMLAVPYFEKVCSCLLIFATFISVPYINQQTASSQPYGVLFLRFMLAVPSFEKACTHIQVNKLNLFQKGCRV